MYRRNFVFVVLTCGLFISCNDENIKVVKALESIEEDDIKRHIAVIASDEFQGRAPATEGEQKTITYLAEQFEKAGLKPASNGSFFQEVPLVKLTADPMMKLEITGVSQKVSLKFSDDFIGGTPQLKENVSLNNSDIIFVGYGINSPEYGWNDYEGIDVRGKTVIMLVNDPGYATGDTLLFKGKEMTIYGRWTYKFEEAARQGAAGAFIIHETGAAAYPWAVVQNSWSGPQYYLRENDLAKSDLLVKGWVTNESARKIFESAGIDFDSVTNSASKRDFKPVEMKLRVSVSFNNKVEYAVSNNVAAIWPGSERSDEYVIYMAHWDHFGVNPSFEGDSILNGAVDNATGTAGLIELAEAFTLLPKKQKRSIMFLSVTCEEQGLLGSRYYAENPLVPLNKTAGVINMDGLNILGRTKDMTIIGLGNSELDDYALEVLSKYGRYANPDQFPEKGNYFRSDHYNFAKAGVPALYLGKGVDDVSKGKDWGMAQSEKWIMENYHKPSDNYEPDIWKFDGMIEDIKVYFEIGYKLSNTNRFPEWKPGSQFKPARDAMMTKIQ